MKKSLVLIIFIFTSIIPMFLLTGCSANKSIDNLAYVISIGFDTGKDDKLKIYFELATPNTSEGSGSSDGGTSEKTSTSTVVSVDCSSIDSGLNLLNSHISKPVNLSHCNIIIFSSKLAESRYT